MISLEYPETFTHFHNYGPPPIPRQSQGFPSSNVILPILSPGTRPNTAKCRGTLTDGKRGKNIRISAAFSGISGGPGCPRGDPTGSHRRRNDPGKTYLSTSHRIIGGHRVLRVPAALTEKWRSRFPFYRSNPEPPTCAGAELPVAGSAAVKLIINRPVFLSGL